MIEMFSECPEPLAEDCQGDIRLRGYCRGHLVVRCAECGAVVVDRNAQ